MSAEPVDRAAPASVAPVPLAPAPLARVANVGRTMEILEALSGVVPGATVTELTERLAIPKSVVSRILATLVEAGYVTRDPLSSRFHLSLRMIALVTRHVDRLGLEDLCGPLLREFAAECGELVQMALIEGAEMRYVLRGEAQRRVRVVSILGARVALHAFAAGKIWLASLPPDRALARALAEGLTPLTRHTITGAAALAAELDRVREEGLAFNLEEVDEGLHSMAAPIRSPKPDAALLGAVAMTGPSFRLPKPLLLDWGPRLAELGRRLGEILSASRQLQAAT